LALIIDKKITLINSVDMIDFKKIEPLIDRALSNIFIVGFLGFLLVVILVLIPGLSVDNGQVSFHIDGIRGIILHIMAFCVFVFLCILIVYNFKKKRIKYFIEKKINKEGDIDAVINELENENYQHRDAMLFAYVQESPLDYLAYFTGGVIKGQAYCPDLAEKLSRHNIERDTIGQIDLYRQVGVDLFETVNKLNDSFKELRQGLLVRLILDVKKGGIFYFHIDDDSQSYLIGATIDQQNMDNLYAEKLMRSVEKKIASN